MIPYDIDPSLHTGEPAPSILDDGFSPRAAQQPDLDADEELAEQDGGAALPARSQH